MSTKSKLSSIVRIVRKELSLYFKSSSIILYYPTLRSKKNVVNINYWISSLKKKDVPYNLGDELSPLVVDYMLRRKDISAGKKVSKTRHLYAIGSILQMGYQNATVWGTGFLKNYSMARMLLHRFPFRKLDVRAVRGPYTREFLQKLGHKCPDVYGDPAILMPMIYQPSVRLQKSDFAIIPHYDNDKLYTNKYGKLPGIDVISMVTNDYKDVIDRICSAKVVISGSLHGIILAEAYGVPVIFLRDREPDKDFKYNDYYASTNRDNYKYASSVEEAFTMQPETLPDNMCDLQRGLIESFPYDLWNK